MAQKITHRDIINMISTAKSLAATQVNPVIVTNTTMNAFDGAQVAMIETVIMYLNGKGLLLEIPEVDHKERR